MIVSNPNPLARSEVNEIIRWSFPIKKKRKGPSRPFTRAMLDTLRDASIQMEYARETPIIFNPYEDAEDQRMMDEGEA